MRSWRLIPISFIPIGVGLVSLAIGLLHYSWADYFHELAVALFIAGVLSFTVDYYFKRGLLRDAFEAVFGYVLPDYFREELNRIAQEKFVAVSTQIEFEICRIQNTNLVETTWTWVRKFKNITYIKQDYKLLLGVDNFDFPGHPWKVHACTLQLDSDEKSEFLPTESPKNISINSSQKFEIHQKATEIHRDNGAAF